MIDMQTGRAARIPGDIIEHYTIWFRVSNFRFRIFGSWTIEQQSG
jgi:hypothetical protein